jgi:hypothetical protein
MTCDLLLDFSYAFFFNSFDRELRQIPRIGQFGETLLASIVCRAPLFGQAIDSYVTGSLIAANYPRLKFRG